MPDTAEKPSAVEEVNARAIRSIAESRRSVRQFRDEPVPDADIAEMLRLTGLAPSASNVQPWRWAVVRTPDMLARLSEVMTGNNVRTVEGAPACIVLYSDGQEVLANIEQILHPGLGEEEIAKRAGNMRRNLSTRTPEQLVNWAKTQTYIALGQFVLVARGLGYDSVTMGGFQEEGIRELLGLSETASVTSVLAVGKRLQDGFTHHRHAVERVSSWF